MVTSQIVQIFSLLKIILSCKKIRAIVGFFEILRERDVS